MRQKLESDVSGENPDDVTELQKMTILCCINYAIGNVSM